MTPTCTLTEVLEWNIHRTTFYGVPETLQEHCRNCVKDLAICHTFSQVSTTISTSSCQRHSTKYHRNAAVFCRLHLDAIRHRFRIKAVHRICSSRSFQFFFSDTSPLCNHDGAQHTFVTSPPTFRSLQNKNEIFLKNKFGCVTQGNVQ